VGTLFGAPHAVKKMMQIIATKTDVFFISLFPRDAPKHAKRKYPQSRVEKPVLTREHLF
jgi:hypothetical protein